MKATKAILLALLAIAALYGLTRLFLDSLGGGSSAGAAAGVLFAPPPGFRTDEGGELARADAARRLLAALDGSPAESRRGLHFTSQGFELYWLVDRADPAAPRLVELSAGPTGTRLETTFAGDPRLRLAAAAQTGRLDAPGLPAGESHNLYH